MRNLLRQALAGLLPALLAAQAVVANPGGFDPSFDFNGIVITNFQKQLPTQFLDGGVIVSAGASSDHLVSMFLQPDGRILAVGHRDHIIMRLTPAAPTYDVNDPFDFAVARYLPNGKLDPSFGTGGRASIDMGASQEIAAGAFVVDGGKILVVGSCDDKTGLVRYFPNGTIDTSFGDQGRAYLDISLNWECTPIQQPDGKILLSGNRFFRIDPDGTLDETFGKGGRAVLPAGVSAMTLLPDGSILLAGVKNDYAYVLMRLTPAGVLDSGFGVDGVVPIDLHRIHDIAVLPDGKYAVATGWGGAYPTTERSKFCIARINANGTLDQTFGTQGKTLVDFDGEESFSTQIAVGTDGKIIAAGFIPGSGKDDAMAVTRFEADGSLDATFGNQGKVVSYITHSPFGQRIPITATASERTNALLVQPDGKLLLGGTVCTAYNTTGYDFLLARLLVDNSPASADYEPDVVLALDPIENPEARARSVLRPRIRNLTVNVRNLGTRLDRVRLQAKAGNRNVKLKINQSSSSDTILLSKSICETGYLSPEDVLQLQLTVQGTPKLRRSAKVNVVITAQSTSDSRSIKLATLRLRGGALLKAK